MCRWLAYSGPSIRLSDVLTKPDHSLIDQSRRARQNVVTTNGDGLGVGWYDERRKAGLYRDTHPAWNDANFHNLADHVRSSLFLSHVRAATGTPVQNTNCHPFAFENWLFQHNGQVLEFSRVKRQLTFDVDAELFPHMKGSTDSEVLFFLALTFGLRDDPLPALSQTIRHVERVCRETHLEAPVYFSACLSDGSRLWTVRYASDNDSPTQYHSRHIHALRDLHGTYEPLPDGAVLVVSEPLDELSSHWEEVPESSCLFVENGEVTTLPFAPE